MVERPFADKRLFGPFIGSSEPKSKTRRLRQSDISWFSKIEITTLPGEEELNYKVVGTLPGNRGTGLTLKTIALVVNGSDGATIAVFEKTEDGEPLSVNNYDGTAALEISAPGKGKVGIGQADRQLVDIIIKRG